MVHDHDWQNEPPLDFNKSYDEHYGDEEDEAMPERKRFFSIEVFPYVELEEIV